MFNASWTTGATAHKQPKRKKFSSLLELLILHTTYNSLETTSCLYVHLCQDGSILLDLPYLSSFLFYYLQGELKLYRANKDKGSLNLHDLLLHGRSLGLAMSQRNWSVQLDWYLLTESLMVNFDDIMWTWLGSQPKGTCSYKSCFKEKRASLIPAPYFRRWWHRAYIPKLVTEVFKLGHARTLVGTCRSF